MNINNKTETSSHVKQSTSKKLTKREKDKLRKQREKQRLISKRSDIVINPISTAKEESDFNNQISDELEKSKNVKTQDNEIKDVDKLANLNIPIYFSQDSQNVNDDTELLYPLHVSGEIDNRNKDCSDAENRTDIHTKNEVTTANKFIDENCLSDLSIEYLTTEKRLPMFRPIRLYNFRNA